MSKKDRLYTIHQFAWANAQRGGLAALLKRGYRETPRQFYIDQLRKSIADGTHPACRLATAHLVDIYSTLFDILGVSLP